MNPCSMNSCSDPLSHAPGYQTVHMMPKAGMASDMVSADSEVFRYNRVTPYYPNDPCIRPNEADVTCPADRPGNQNHLLPSAGVSTAHGDTFQNYQTRGPLTQGQCMGAYGSHPCKNTQPITGPEDCPCSNRGRLDRAPRHQQPMPPARGTFNNGCTPRNRQGNLPGCGNPYPPLGPTKCTGDFNCRKGLVTTRQRPAVSGPNYPSFAPGDPGNFPMKSTYQGNQLVTSLGAPDPLCPAQYYPAPYVCRPVYNRKYLMDCPEQDGPPGDSYTFL